MNDLRIAVRGLFKQPAFTIISVLTLALGIGANTSIFSVVEGVLLRDLPYRDPARLVSIGERSEIPNARNIGFMTFLDWQARTHAFESMAVYRTLDATLSGIGIPEQIRVLQGSGDFPATLGVDPIQGRAWTADEASPTAERVVLLSYGFWQRRFGGQPDIIGQSINLNELPYRVIGILPASFGAYFAQTTVDETSISAMSPLRYSPTLGDSCRTCRHLRAIARIREHVTLDDATKDLLAVHDAMTREMPSDYKTSRRAMLIPLHDTIVAAARQPLAVVWAAAAILLVATCLNVSTLILIRATQKQNELTIRAVLGARTFALVRQCVIESVSISLVGGVIGISLAVWMTPALTKLAPSTIPRIDEVTINSSVLAVAVALTLLSGFATAAIPSFQILRRLAGLNLQPGNRWIIGQQSGRSRRQLIIGGLACTFALLVAVGLIVKSFDKLMRVDPGFQTDGLVVMNLNSVGPRYPRPEDDIRFFNRIVESVKAQTGIEAVAATSVLPISGNYDMASFQVEGQTYTPDAAPSADRYVVTPDYLTVLGIPIRRGRGFSERDSADSPKVVLINETAARRFFGSEDPVGKRVRAGDEARSIVGVVGDVRQYRLDLEPTAQFYLPLAQQSRGYMTLVVKGRGSPREVVAAVNRAVIAIDSTRALSLVSTIDELMSASVAPRRFVLRLLSGYGGLSVLLAVIGVYGTMSFTTMSRTREIGIRMALGAQRSEIFSMFLRQVAGLALPALVIGGLLIAAAAPVIRDELFEVESLDPLVIILAAAGLTGVAVSASLSPIRRATLVDPTVSLRED